MHKPALILLLLVALGASATAPEQGAVDVVLGHLIESYGGEANLRQLDAMEQLWSMQTHVSRGDGHDFRRVLLPDSLLVELTYPSHTERRLLTHLGAYNNLSADSLTPASPPQAAAMRLQLMRLYSPLTLRAQKGRLEYRDDDELCVLSLVEEGLRVDYLIDKHSWRIVKVAGTMQVQGVAMQFLTEYSDFRKEEGVLIHHRENKFAGEINTATLELLRVDLDLPLNASDFLPDGSL